MQHITTFHHNMLSLPTNKSHYSSLHQLLISDYATSKRWMQKCIPFTLWKRYGLRKPKMFHVIFDWYHLNQSQGWP